MLEEQDEMEKVYRASLPTETGLQPLPAGCCTILQQGEVRQKTDPDLSALLQTGLLYTVRRHKNGPRAQLCLSGLYLRANSSEKVYSNKSKYMNLRIDP
ncbi:hypothetical protein [Pontibacter flavimaris]|uniref:hypothetical protein n=1 Tax=Pontibacter flavimaris TaxID=1797110 RepID=UPI0011153CDB|nr:hypothetical protein [Pontibacter flavimaris]